MKEIDILKIVSDENRVKIIQLIVKGEECSCDLLSSLDISQPTLSYHLKQLHLAGIIRSQKEGTKVHYSVNKELLYELASFIKSLTVSEQYTCQADK